MLRHYSHIHEESIGQLWELLWLLVLHSRTEIKANPFYRHNFLLFIKYG
jgi:hypothetical protein